MSKSLTNPLVKPSLLHRLIDDEPYHVNDTFMNSYTLDVLKKDILKDINALLNQTQVLLTWPDTLTALNESVLNYGIPDFTCTQYGIGSKRELLREQLEISLKLFETRFELVNIYLEESDDDTDKRIIFRIEGLIHIKAEMEPVTFNTLFDLVHGNFYLEG